MRRTEMRKQLAQNVEKNHPNPATPDGSSSHGGIFGNLVKFTEVNSHLNNRIFGMMMTKEGRENQTRLLGSRNSFLGTREPTITTYTNSKVGNSFVMTDDSRLAVSNDHAIGRGKPKTHKQLKNESFQQERYTATSTNALKPLPNNSALKIVGGTTIEGSPGWMT